MKTHMQDLSIYAFCIVLSLKTYLSMHFASLRLVGFGSYNIVGMEVLDSCQDFLH